jgi:putative ABC transport system permease protein
MIVRLIFRNVTRGLSRLAPMMLVLGSTMALLLLGNSISQAVNQGYQQTFVDQITGHLSISSTADQPFTIFGSDALLVGNLIPPPILLQSQEIFTLLDQDDRVEALAGLVTLAGRVEMNSRPVSMPLFGVDFVDYKALVPGFSFLQGNFPQPGEPGIIIHENRIADFARLRGSIPQLGDPVLITTATNSSFTIRELPLVGIFTYPAQDQILERVGIIDADTARSLQGLLFGDQIQQSADTGLDINGLFDDPFAGLFDTVEDGFVDSTIETGMDELFTDPLDLLLGFDGPADQSTDPVHFVSSPPRAGEYHFVLIRLRPGVSESQFQADLQRQIQTTFPYDFQTIDLRNWRETAGGSAQLVWFVQVFFTLGLLFVAFGASVITINALVLSVLERQKEIGTMRALGASKGTVGIMITGETLVVVAGSSFMGMVLGVVLTLAINSSGIPIRNQLLQFLFGQSTLFGILTPGLLLTQLVLGIFLGGLSALYPLVKALKITPLKAMAGP